MGFAFSIVYIIFQVFFLSIKCVFTYWVDVISRRHDLTGRESVAEYLSHIFGFGIVSFILYLVTEHFVYNDINRPMKMQLIMWLVGFCIWLFILYLPLHSCTARRLNDAGLDRTLASAFRRSWFFCILLNVIIPAAFKFFFRDQLIMAVDDFQVIKSIMKMIYINYMYQLILSVYYIFFFLSLVLRRSSYEPVKTVMTRNVVRGLVVIPNIIAMIAAVVTVMLDMNPIAYLMGLII